MERCTAALGLLLVLCTPFGSSVPLSSFYTYGEGVDTKLSGTDDQSSPAISLPGSMLFFQAAYNVVFVSLCVRTYYIIWLFIYIRTTIAVIACVAA